MTRTTKADVRGMFAAYCAAVEKTGVDVSAYRLREGDSDHAWLVLDEARGSQTGGVGFGVYGYAGENTREAYRALYVAASLLQDLHYRARREELAVR